MPMKVRYTSVNGEIIAENRGGVRKLYLSDPLGSTLALADDTQTITDRFTYWPYGEEASRTGTTPTPFRFMGTRGLYWAGNGRSYAVGGSLLTRLGSWAGPGDPLGVAGATRTYAEGGPVSKGLLLGQQPISPGLKAGQCPGKYALDFIDERLRDPKLPRCKKAFNKACRSPRGGLRGKLKHITFEVSDNCLALWPHAASGCTIYDAPPDRPCRPRTICYNRGTCQIAGMYGEMIRACLLLLETVNWCSCEQSAHLSGWSERAAKEVIEACGLSMTCRPLSL